MQNQYMSTCLAGVNAKAYVEFLEKISGAPISAIGVGPGRDETIVVRDLIK